MGYITGIGISSCGQYSQLGQSVSHSKPQKCIRIAKEPQKMATHFSNSLMIATKQKCLEAYNLAILVDKAFCQLCVVMRSSLVQYIMRCSSPSNKAISKCRHF